MSARSLSARSNGTSRGRSLPRPPRPQGLRSYSVETIESVPQVPAPHHEPHDLANVPARYRPGRLLVYALAKVAGAADSVGFYLVRSFGTAIILSVQFRVIDHYLDMLIDHYHWLEILK